MDKTLPVNIKQHQKPVYLIVLLVFIFIQKSNATTFYVNDNDSKGDIYTTALGNDSNDGTSKATPKLTIRAAYEAASDGDTIIVDTGIYSEISENGKILFDFSKRISLTIAGIPNPIFSKIRIPKENNHTETFYVIDDQPVDRKTYFEQRKKRETKKSR